MSTSGERFLRALEKAASRKGADVDSIVKLADDSGVGKASIYKLAKALTAGEKPA
jgi:hypothetical protein